MPTLKAIHICNSHQPTLQPKIAKEYVFANADRQTKKNNEGITRVWQKWRFSAPQTVLWLNKHWFSASTFVVKIATFAKRQNVTCKLKNDRTKLKILYL
jgi:hypothetical protein